MPGEPESCQISGYQHNRGVKVLISGAGIAGPTLAWWLLRHGIEPVIVEHAPQLRTGGYVIDFWGAGFDVADKMGLLPEVRQAGYAVEEVRIVNAAGKRIAGFSVDVFRRLTDNRYVSLARGDLAAILFRAVEGRVETIFGDSITSIDRSDDRVHVAFEHGVPRDFDAVVGADGLHSRVREVAFGPERQYEKFLGYYVAAFECRGYRPHQENIYVMFTDVGKQVARFAMRDDRTLVLFVFADADPDLVRGGDIDGQKAAIRDRFRGTGWETDAILEAMEPVRSLYFDRVSQVRMDTWSEGRVGLVGDAAYCVSLLGGQGSALAMIGAYVLAYELSRPGSDPASAFHRYHARLAQFLAQKQRAAVGFAKFFAPQSRLQLRLRNAATRLFAFDWVSSLVSRTSFLDRIDLPQ